MKFIAIKTSNGYITGKIALYCQVLKVSRQGFYYYLESLDKPWKYEALAAKIYEILVLFPVTKQIPNISFVPSFVDAESFETTSG